MRKKAENSIIILTAVFFICFTLVSFRYFNLASESPYLETAMSNSFITINADPCQGTIYDRNMNPLTNRKYYFQAVIVPDFVNYDEIAKYAQDREYFDKKFREGKPFSFRLTSEIEETDAITVFRIPVRYSGRQTAQHITGYLSDNQGVSGIEYAYNRILRNENNVNSVTYSTDGFGNILIGDGKTVRRSNCADTGAVLTIDRDIQGICENAGKFIRKGAVIVSDVNNGDILALVSFPQYQWYRIEEAVENENSPLINRALCPYGVGSIFKLVTACEGINEGYENYIYDCKGMENISGQIFNCHKLDGHGRQTMSDAIKNSCNTYFINMSRSFDIVKFRSLAVSFGFGREIQLCEGIISSSGVIPTAEDLNIPAELANFSFGQGKLSATPLQINRFTCAVANGGELPFMRIIKGITVDGKNTSDKSIHKTRIINSDTAEILRNMMISAVSENENSNASAENISVGAKTSTAQTGRFDDSGEEFCHAWITGFFPAENPEYAVTVLVEDGGYGNEAAAPIFREIAENIAELKKSRK